MPGFIAILIVSIIVAWLANTVTRNNIPGEFWGAFLASFVGCLIGGYLPVLATIGPNIGGVAIVPAIVASVIGVFLLGLVKSIAVQTK